MAAELTATIAATRPMIAVNGNEDSALSGQLKNLMIVETVEGLYRCEASFFNWGTTGKDVGYLYLDRQKLDFGKQFEVKIGVDKLFDGRIMGIEAAYTPGAVPEVTILAEDRFQDLRMTRRTRAFENVSDADLFQRIASDHGLTADVSVSGPTYKTVAQINQSDLAFLRERGRRAGAELWVEGTALKVRRRGNRGTATLAMTYQAKLREFSVSADLAMQFTALTVSGWDVAGKNAVKYEASDSTISNELNGMKSGASVLNSALGVRKESITYLAPATSTEAQGQAEALFRTMARRFVKGRGIGETDPQLRVGIQVDLQGLGGLFDGKYYVTEIRHCFDRSQGLRTEFSVERPGIG